MENSTIVSPTIIQQCTESSQRQLKSNQELQVGTVSLYGVHIVSLIIERQERLCLAQISNTLLKQFSYNEIHNRRVALGITCVQCTPVQLEILRRAGAMPMSSRRCGMITRREAERLCKSFLGDNAPPRLPEDFAFLVHHECAWGCKGAFVPARYNSSRAKCIKCAICGLFFSPNKFIFHSHQTGSCDKYIEPDAANFNSWRRHMKLSGQPPDEIIHAWEDVKAMFNGGTRKRILSSSSNSNMPIISEKHNHVSPIRRINSTSIQSSLSGSTSVSTSVSEIMQRRVPSFSNLTLRIPGNRVIDYMWNRQHQTTVTNGVKSPGFSILSYLPWLTKRNSVLFPTPVSQTIGSITSTETATSYNIVNNTSYQSAFHPVIKAETLLQGLPMQEMNSVEECISSNQENTDDEVDVETMEDDISLPAIRNISNLNSSLSIHDRHSVLSQCWSPPRELDKISEQSIKEVAVTTDIKTELTTIRSPENWNESSSYQQFNIVKDAKPLNCSNIDCLNCKPRGFLYGVAHTSSASFI